MLYHVSRNGQTYGPYTLEDLQRYLASGNVLPTDQVKSEEMAGWTSVAQLLSGQGGGQPATEPVPVTPVYSAPATPQTWPNPAYAPTSGLTANPNQYPDAPNLNWGLVLLFDFLTCGLFQYIWNLVIAAWTRRVQPNSTSLFYYIGVVALGFASLVLSFVFNLHNAMFGAGVVHPSVYGVSPGFNFIHIPGLFPRISVGLITWIVKLIARFQQRESMLQHFNGPEPLGLQLSGVMTFFFGGLYFQYHLNRLNQLKQAARYGAPRY